MEPKKYITLLLCLFLFLVTITPRYILINNGLFHHDSVQLAKAVEGSIETKELMPAVNNRYGLVFIYSLMHMIYYPFDISYELSVTLTTIILAGIASIFTFLFTSYYFKNQYIGFYTTLLLNFNPIFFSTSTYAKSHAMALLCMMACLYFLLLAIDTEKNSSFILSGSFFILLLLTRIDGIFIIFSILFLLYKDRKNTRQKAYYVGILFIITLILFLTEIIFIYSIDIPKMLLREKLFLLVYSSVSLIDSIIPILFMLILYGIYYMWKINKRLEVLFLSLFFLTTFLPMSIMNSFEPRLLLYSIVPLYMILSFLLNEFKNKYIKVSLLIIAIISTFMPYYDMYEFRHSYSSGKEMALFLEYNLNYGSSIELEDMDGGVFIDYYSKKRFNITKDGDYLFTKEKWNYTIINKTIYEGFHRSTIESNINTFYLYKRS